MIETGLNFKKEMIHQCKKSYLMFAQIIDHYTTYTLILLYSLIYLLFYKFELSRKSTDEYDKSHYNVSKITF